MRQRRLSEAVSLARLSEVCDLYIPLQPPLDLPGARSASPQVPICRNYSPVMLTPAWCIDAGAIGVCMHGP